MKVHLRALIIVTLIGAAFIAAYFIFTKPNYNETAERPAAVDVFTKDGLTDFSVTDTKGNTWGPKNFQGKILIVNFWASWCGPCVEEIPSLGELMAKLGPRAVLVAVNADERPEEMTAFLKSYPEFNKDNILVVWQNHKELMKQFDIEKLPESFIFDSNLKLRKRVSGSINWSSPATTEYINGIK
ncbi:MAG: TlpA disulfide reductase family protein [Bdellovibrionota bacterium]